MSILIIGSGGNLGSKLKNLTVEAHGVICWDREDIDVTNGDEVRKKINTVNPRVIINATGFNNVDACEEVSKFKLAKKVNGEAVGYLAQAALDISAVLVHYSSDYVFSGDDEKGYNEEAEPKPINKYGKSKLMGEQEILKLKELGLKYYLIRTSKLFGSQATSQSAKPSFFDIMLKLAKTKKEIKVIDEEVSCFTYTKDLAEATKALIEDNKETGIYHIVNSNPCTWYEAAQELFKLARIDVKINPVTADKFSRPAKRPKYSVLLNTKLKPMRDWKEALEDYIGNHNS